MAELFKVEHLAPAANTAAELYKVPSGKKAVISQLYVANVENAENSFTIRVYHGTESTDSNAQVLAVDHVISALNTTWFPGIVLGCVTINGTEYRDSLVVKSNDGNVAFTAFIVEVG